MEPHNFSTRRDRVRERISDLELDAILVSAQPNIRYLTGFTGSSGLFLLSSESATLFTDPRYELQAAEESDCRLRVTRGPLAELAGVIIRRRRFKKIGFEAHRLIYAAHETLRESLPAGAHLIPASGIVEEFRAVKSGAEIDCIRSSVRLCSRAFERAVRRARPGLQELELAAHLDHEIRRLGAEGAAFDTIVASGRRSALPHASPTAKRLASPELVLIDVGAQLDGYSSDMTRVLHLGPVSRRARQMHAAVLEAQLAAIDSVKDGVQASAVDRAARRILSARRMEPFVMHSTGHGLGLEIHEPPRLGKGDRTCLQAGMVITVEPGVYVKGFGGVRIEDTVVVTGTGCEILTPTAKELIVI